MSRPFAAKGLRDPTLCGFSNSPTALAEGMMLAFDDAEDLGFSDLRHEGALGATSSWPMTIPLVIAHRWKRRAWRQGFATGFAVGVIAAFAIYWISLNP